MRIENPACGAVDYRMNLLGIRVSSGTAQLIAKDRGDWTTLGPVQYLPLQVPTSALELQAGVNDTLLLTAYQYQAEHPNSDLREVLAQSNSATALANKPMAAGSVL